MCKLSQDQLAISREINSKLSTLISHKKQIHVANAIGISKDKINKMINAESGVSLNEFCQMLVFLDQKTSHIEAKTCDEDQLPVKIKKILDAFEQIRTAFGSESQITKSWLNMLLKSEIIKIEGDSVVIPREYMGL